MTTRGSASFAPAGGLVPAAELEAASDWVAGGVTAGERALLLSPLRIGAVTLPNRFVMSAMGTRAATADGDVTDLQIAYYARRAHGGVGTVMVEGSSVHPNGTTYVRKPRLYHDRFVPGLARLAEAIRAEGAVAGIQLMHAGRHASPATRTGPAATPSGGTSRVGGTSEHGITEEEIAEIIAAFASAARRACDAGFQVVELHAAHGYLIHDFLSPLQNRRDDTWGGDVQGRARLLVDVVRAVKSAIPRDAAAVIRLSSSEIEPGGITPDDAAVSAALAERAGVDAVLVSGGTNEHIEWIVPPVFMPFALYLDAAARIRRDVGVPVGVVGRISTPRLAAEAISSGRVDLVMVGRALLSDPDFVRKLADPSSAGPIRPCIACNECLAQHIRDETILCTVNPAAAHEAEESAMASPARTPRTIVVVGAGPAGLLFSALATERGHRVTLVDRQERVGGKLWLAAAAPYKTREMLALYTALELEVRRRAVDVRLGTDDVAGAVADTGADLVVVSSGATPRPHQELDTSGGATVMQAEEYLTLGHDPGWRQVAILGAGDTACDAAVRLAESGVRVWLLARGNRIARGIEPVSGRVLRRYLAELGVEVVVNCDVRAIQGRTLRYRAAGPEGDAAADAAIEVDQVLFARGVEPSAQGILDSLELGAGVERRVIGDAGDPGNFLTSLRSAWNLALELS